MQAHRLCQAPRNHKDAPNRAAIALAHTSLRSSFGRRRHCAVLVAALGGGLSSPAREAVALARQEAGRHGCVFAGPEHLLLGILAAPGSEAATLLSAHGVTAAAARARLDPLHVLPQTAASAEAAARDVDFSPALQSTLAAAAAAAGTTGRRVGTAQLLVSLLRQPPTGALAAALGNTSPSDLLNEAQAAVASGPEEAAGTAPASAGDQAAMLKRLYEERLQEQARGGGGGRGTSSGGGGYGSQPGRQLTQQELDDIYE